MNEEMSTKAQMIFTKEDMERIVENIREDGKREVSVDLHRFSVKEAKRFLQNIIAIENDTYTMKVIHGYNHGTAIRDMIQADINNKRITKKEVSEINPGMTFLMIAAA